MKKITTVKDLLQLFVTEDEVFEISMKYDYAETARKFDFLQLLHFWMIASTEKWESYRAAETELQNHPDLPAVTYSTLAKKAKSVPYQIFRDIFQKLLQNTNRSFKRNFLKKYRLNVLDSTMITFTHPENQWEAGTQPAHGNINPLVTKEYNILIMTILLLFRFI